MSGPTVDRASLAGELERARADFQQLLAVADDHDWGKPTSGTRWTNEQMLCHMLFGYMLVRRLLFLVRIFDRLPDRASVGFARMLDAAASPFHVINYYASCAAALALNRHRMGNQMNRVIGKLQRSLANESDDAFRRGMHYPPRWDPYFCAYMTLADVYRYPNEHYAHHRRQLTLSADLPADFRPR